MLDKLKSTGFTPHLNRKFLIHIGEPAPREAELLEVRDLGAAGPKVQRKPFAITLRGPRDRRLPQMIYKVEH